jgi:hypothetical protein
MSGSVFFSNSNFDAKIVDGGPSPAMTKWAGPSLAATGGTAAA